MDYKKLYDQKFSGNYSNPDYRHQFLENNLKTLNIDSAIDLGSGRGHTIRILQKFPLVKITAFDLNNYHNIHGVNHINGSLCSDDDLKGIINENFDLAVCLDVIEHLEEDCANNIISVISKISEFAILSIAATIEPPVHITIKPKEYWDDVIKKYFEILVEEEDPRPVFYYVLKSINKTIE